MVKFSQDDFVAEQKAGHELKLITRDLTSKVFIITGANTGLGYETAIHIARQQPARLILACRSTKTGEEAVEKIKSILTSESIDSKTQIEVWQLDLSDSKSVKAFTEKVNGLDRLDCFIANAGMVKQKRELTSDGFEMSLQVNNISNTYITSRIAPLLIKTGETHPDKQYTPHLTIVASSVHLYVEDFEEKEGKGVLGTLNEVEGEKMNSRYNQTKAINLLDCIALVKKFPQGIVINTVNPGLNHSSLDRHLDEGPKAHLGQLKENLAWPADLGSRNIVYAALTDDPSGSYITRTRVEEPSDLLISPRAQELSEKIWKEYEQIWAKW